MKIRNNTKLHQLAKTYGWVGNNGASPAPGPIDGTFTSETDPDLVLHPDGSGGTVWGPDAIGVIVEDEGSPLATTATTLDFVGAGVTATGTGATKTITIPGGGAGSGTPGWFNVKDPAYGAVGDGSTDDTAAINLAIAALVAAGRGVLYFPYGTYKTTGALTTLSVPCLVLGDGSTSYDNASPISEVRCTSQTAVLFTVSTKACRFEKLALVNTYAGTPSAGAAVLVDSAYLEQRCDFEGIFVQGFYDNLDVKVGGQWTMHASMSIAPVRYGIRIRNTVNPDAGDWSITDSNFSAQSYDSTAGIQVESSGGGKIVNVKVNMALDGKKFNDGIALAAATGVDTGDLLIANSSIENVRQHGIHITTSSGTSKWRYIALTGLQVGLGSNTTGNGLNVTCTTLADVYFLEVDNCIFGTDGASSQYAISLTKVNVAKMDCQSDGFGGGTLTTSGCTNIFDATGGVGSNVYISGAATTGYVPTATGTSTATWQAAPGGGVTGFATPAIVLGAAAAAGAATTVIRSDATIVAFDATTPATQAFGDAGTVGTAGVAPHRDHKHPMPAAAVTTNGLTMATGKILGRSTASTGAIEEITVGTNLTLSGGTLSATGGSGTTATDANIWRPVMDGGGNVVTDGSGQAVMAWGPA